MVQFELIEKYLSHSPIFLPLSADLRRIVASRMQPISCPAGTVVFSRGDPGDAVYLVIDGRIRLSIVSRDGRELAFDHSMPGSIFGEIAVLDGAARSADATAISASRLMKLSRAAFIELMSLHPEIGSAVISFLCSRLRDVSDQLEDIAFLPVEVRLARYLIRCAAAQTHTLAANRVKLGVSQTEIGYLIGASRQKTNEALSALEAQGAVTRVGSELHCEFDLLEQIANG